MLICNECGNEFFEDEVKATYDRVPYGDQMVDMPSYDVCPNCGSEYIEEAVRCKRCGEYMPQSFNADCLCQSCCTEIKECFFKMMKKFWNSLEDLEKQFVYQNIECWIPGGECWDDT